MKNVFLFPAMILAFVCTVSASAKTDYAAMGIERRVLFTMNDHEVCDYVETWNLFPGVKQCRSELKVRDTVAGTTTYILDGERVLSAQSMGVYLTQEGVPTRDSLCMVYKKQENWYLSLRGNEYGPYDGVSYLGYDDKFIFAMGDATFMHDADGVVYPLSPYPTQGRTFFQSPNKKHTAYLSPNNIYTIHVDNHPYTIEPLPEENKWDKKIAEVFVLDDGSCIVEYGRHNIYDDEFEDYLMDGTVKDLRPDVHVYFDYSVAYHLADGKATKLEDNQYFDKREKKIKIWPPTEETNELPFSFVIDSYGQSRCTFPGEMFSREYADVDESTKVALTDYVVNQIGFSIWDEKHEHHFFGLHGFGYLYIDQLGIPSVYPERASHNIYVNAFRWIVVEGKDVVYYSYQLPK